MVAQTEVYVTCQGQPIDGVRFDNLGSNVACL